MKKSTLASVGPRVAYAACLALLLSSCGGGHDGGSSPVLSGEIRLNASTDLESRVHLSWTAAAGEPASYVVYRDGAVLTTLPNTNLSFDDASSEAAVIAAPASLRAS